MNNNELMTHAMAVEVARARVRAALVPEVEPTHRVWALIEEAMMLAPADQVASVFAQVVNGVTSERLLAKALHPTVQ